MAIRLQRKLGFFSMLTAAIALGIASCETTDTALETPINDEGVDEGVVEDTNLNARLNGAGASFPAPLYQRWFSEINQEYPGVQVSYQSVGSGAGVEQFLAGTVDFGATDAPLTEEERQSFVDQYGAQPIQIPMTAGSVVFAYNLEGVEDLRLSRDAYCGIVAGEIDTWNDPAIAEANPNTELPNEPINWVHRSDGSGTTFLFTNHIQEACPNWTVGAAKTVDWPVGIGAQGNEGIAAQVQQTAGSIGYVEYAYANENDISMATIENQAGNFIEPSPDSAGLVFEGVEVPEDFALTVPDPENPEAYPIAGLTWLLMYPEYENPETGEALQLVVDWALEEGDDVARELGYIPLPQDVETRVQNTVEEQIAAR